MVIFPDFSPNAFFVGDISNTRRSISSGVLTPCRLKTPGCTSIFDETLKVDKYWCLVFDTLDKGSCSLYIINYLHIQFQQIYLSGMDKS